MNALIMSFLLIRHRTDAVTGRLDHRISANKTFD